MADSIRQAIHGYRFLWGANSLSVGASIGVVRIARETTSAASVLSAADIACYAAKDGGRNRVQVYERDHGTNRHREMQWVGRIARAVEEGRLELCAQRIVPIAPWQGDGIAPTTPRYAVLRAHGPPARRRRHFGAAQRIHPGRRTLQRHGHGGPLGRRTTRSSISPTASRPPPACRCWPSTSRERRSTTRISSSSCWRGSRNEQVARPLCFEITETAAVASLAKATILHERAQGARLPVRTR